MVDAILKVLTAILIADLAVAIFHSGGHPAKPAAAIKTGAHPATTAQPPPPPASDTGSPTTSTTSAAAAAGAAPPATGVTGGSAAPGPSGRLYAVTQAVPLRSGPSQSSSALDTVPSGTMVGIQCKASGDSVSGPYGADSWWNKITYGAHTGFVTDEYVDTKGDEADDTKVPRC